MHLQGKSSSGERAGTRGVLTWHMARGSAAAQRHVRMYFSYRATEPRVPLFSASCTAARRGEEISRIYGFRL